MVNFCKYQKIFGEPNKGAHSYRIFNLAMVDVIGTIVIAYIISLYNRSFLYTLVILFALGIILHRLFCVRTTLDTILFPNG
jgi:hypothetical protein